MNHSSDVSSESLSGLVRTRGIIEAGGVTPAADGDHDLSVRIELRASFGDAHEDGPGSIFLGPIEEIGTHECQGDMSDR